ncbi:glycosyltransferase [Mailhella sp.]
MQEQLIVVKNAEGDANSVARVIVQNNIDYTPKVSVIIPVYNTEDYLRECLDSVIEQTLEDIEIICVDDGSTDNSLDILKEYAEKDRRITILAQQNLFAGVARNAGIAVAKGEYLHFLDSDDWLSADSYQTLYEIIKQQQVDFIKFKSFSYDNEKKQVVERGFTDMALVPSCYFNKKLSFANDYAALSIASDAPWSGLYLRNFIDKNGIRFDNLRCANDVTFYFKCLSSCSDVYISDKRFVYYRINNTKSLIGIRAYNFDCQITQIFNTINAVKNSAKHVYEHVKKHCFNALFYRYEMYYNKLNGFDKYKIFNEMNMVINNIDISYLDSKYHPYYTEIKRGIAVSIVIPVYNAEKYIDMTLMSVRKQSLAAIEIICINDASTDNSLEILKRHAREDSRIRIIDNTVNLGAPGAVKNIGISESKGEYIGFVDADDYVDYSYFETLYNSAKEHDADIASTVNVTFFGNVSKKSISLDIDKILTSFEEKSILIENYGSNWSKIYRREFIQKNDIRCYERRSIAEDNLFSMVAMCLANKIVTTSEVSYYYRKHSDSITAVKRTAKEFSILDVYQAVDNILTEKMSHVPELLEKAIRAVDLRKIKDFTWFYNDCVNEDRAGFKKEVQTKFPEIFAKMFCENCIVSLTSWPGRIDTIHTTIKSLLNQTLKAEKIILWLAPEQFPNKEADLPASLLELSERGLTIDWYHDIRSYKKLIPTLRKYPDAIIVTADDDNIYQPTWLEKLYRNYQKYPEDIQAHRVTKFFYHNGFDIVTGGEDYYHEPSYLNKLVGLGGVLYPPHCFHKDILDEELIKRLAPTNDDQWFWLQAARNGVKVRVVDDPQIAANYVPGTQEVGLSQINDKGSRLFWSDFRRIMMHYPELVSLLKEEQNKFNFIPDDHVCKDYKELYAWYKRATGQELDINNPRTFNEKIQWMKLFDSTPIKTLLADKYLVRDWVAERIGEKYLIPLVGAYDRFDEIDFDSLPECFVIKCNHGSGWNIIVPDKSQFNYEEAKKNADIWMTKNYAFHAGCELHYRDIPPKLVVEHFLDEISENVYDYRYFCSYGEIIQIYVDVASGTAQHKRRVYDKNWNALDMQVTFAKLEEEVKLPENLAEMDNLARILSKDLNFVRVDFYNIKNKIYFGEMTFTPTSGIANFEPAIENLRFGNKIKLPNKAYDINTGEYYDYDWPQRKLIAVIKKKHSKDITVYGHSLYSRKTVDNVKSIRLFGLPVYTVKKDNQTKKLSILGIQLFKKRKTADKKRISILGIPVYSKKKHDFRTTTRILFFRHTHKNWGKLYCDLRGVMDSHAHSLGLSGLHTHNLINIALNEMKGLGARIEHCRMQDSEFQSSLLQSAVSLQTQIGGLQDSIEQGIMRSEAELQARVDQLQNSIMQSNTAIKALSEQNVRLREIVKKHTEALSALRTELSKNSQDSSASSRYAEEAVWGMVFNNAIFDSSWLKNKSFSAGRWAAGYPALYTMYRILNEVKPKDILELGLGQSTRMISQYAAAHEDVNHTVIEHDPEWIAFFKRDFETSERTCMVQLDREMTPYKEADAVRCFAGFSEAMQGRKFDFIFIDAPLGGDMKLYSRIDVLKLLPECLHDDFIIMMDDSERTGESNTLREMKNILSEYGITFTSGEYRGAKKCTVICSEPLSFITSM